jgi:hypothetical protein
MTIPSPTPRHIALGLGRSGRNMVASGKPFGAKRNVIWQKERSVSESLQKPKVDEAVSLHRRLPVPMVSCRLR